MSHDWIISDAIDFTRMVDLIFDFDFRFDRFFVFLDAVVFIGRS